MGGKVCKEKGFPIAHKHKLATLRQELVDAFVENRYMMFLKYAALHLQQLSSKKEEDKENDKEDKEKEKDNKDIEDEDKKMVEKVTENIAAEKQVEENTKDIIKKAAAAVGSLKDADFDVRFNPDVFSPGVMHAEPKGPQLKKERQLVC